MKAIVQRRYGGPEVLELGEVEVPTPGPKDILVRVHASTVTQGDRRIRCADFPGPTAPIGQMMFGMFSPRRPTPGTTWAGEVAAVGAEVTEFAVGDRLFGLMMGGAYAEYLVVPGGSAFAPMPPALSYAEAAALPYGANTARCFLVELAGLKPGESVAVVGATGGVGVFAVQLAHHLGAKVTAVARRDQDRLRELGADHVYEPGDGPMLPADRHFDVVLDTTGKLTFTQARRTLAPDGRYLTLFPSTGVLFRMLMWRLIGGPRPMFTAAPDDRARLEAVARIWSEGSFRPVIDRSFPLTEIQAAHRYLEEGHPTGAVSVDVATRVGPKAHSSSAAGDA